VGNPTELTTKLSNRGVEVNYENGSDIVINNTQTTLTKNIIIKNSTSNKVDYQLTFNDVINNITDKGKLTYSYTCVGAGCENRSDLVVPNSNDGLSLIFSLNTNVTHTYQITFSYDGTPTGSFSGIIGLIKPNILIARQNFMSEELFWEHRGNITEVTFENTINIPNGVTSWDASASQDSSVMAYIIDDGLGTNTYKLSIQSNGIFNANPNSAYLFRDFTKLKTINNLGNLNMSAVINMSHMFLNCNSLTSLDLSSFSTSNVTNMYYMFYNCANLTSLNLDLSNFNTANLTSTAQMFNGCSSLTNLNLRNATFILVTSHNLMLDNTTSGINIMVKDVDAKTFIEARLSDANITGNVTIYVP
ncbi:MAG: BspA family leucine-rich repeat surface protein, partial [Mollicutes bacterium]|nr:BspA family leucine-rich repeat surface protein [Mollicutes bacterium]